MLSDSLGKCRCFESAKSLLLAAAGTICFRRCQLLRGSASRSKRYAHWHGVTALAPLRTLQHLRSILPSICDHAGSLLARRFLAWLTYYIFIVFCFCVGKWCKPILSKGSSRPQLIRPFFGLVLGLDRGRCLLAGRTRALVCFWLLPPCSAVHGLASFMFVLRLRRHLS